MNVGGQPHALAALLGEKGFSVPVGL